MIEFITIKIPLHFYNLISKYNIISLYIWGQSPRNESSAALGSIVVIAMYSVYVLKIDPPTTFKIFPKIDLLMSCSLCPQSLGHENISF